jgi:hypothetical protein
MLEILALYFMCKSMGNMLRDKGHKPLGYQVLLVLFWFGGEFVGAVATTVMLALVSGPNAVEQGFNVLAYVGALIGAVMGAGLAFLIAKLLPDRTVPTVTDLYDDRG